MDYVVFFMSWSEQKFRFLKLDSKTGHFQFSISLAAQGAWHIRTKFFGDRRRARRGFNPRHADPVGYFA
ncbi:MAG TPA: hypothetical protein VHC44_04175 [Verrucomicrobiae bacterium]|jgi:hypothetical protein|nr:hypothetical protein [Verrucomicrobiae bacterium]